GSTWWSEVMASAAANEPGGSSSSCSGTERTSATADSGSIASTSYPASASARASPPSPAPISSRREGGGGRLARTKARRSETIVSTALPTIVGDLGGISKLSWVVTAYLLASTVVGPLYGKLGDLYGRKIVLQSAIVIFLIGSVLCGISQNMTELIVFRGIQGL